jgi:hypothetical protein
MEIFAKLLVGAFVIAPLLTLIHEIGHALPSIVTQKKVVIGVGGRKKSIAIKVGNVALRFSVFGFGGYCRYSSNFSTSGQVLAILLGPLISLSIAIALYKISLITMSDSLNPYIEFAYLLAAAQFVFNIIPIKYPRLFSKESAIRSDGLLLLNLFKKSCEPKKSP